MKTTQVSPALRPFWQHFDELTRYYSNYAQVLEDSLTLQLAYYAAPGTMDAERDQVLARYRPEHHVAFEQLRTTTLTCLEAQVAVHGWYDLFGDFYMDLSSRSKASGLGQFFTPVSVVEAMVEAMPVPDRPGLLVADEACGSGRLLLAWQARYGQLLPIYCAADLDPLCCRMAALNLLLHGATGEVLHGNTLTGQWYGAWLVNATLARDGLPSVLPLSRGGYLSWRQYLAAHQNGKEVANEPT